MNQFNQTDYQLDLFHEINKAYYNKESIFDNITQDDLIICFFPCIRFEAQSLLLYRCDNISLKDWNDLDKCKYDIKLINELNDLYTYIMKLVYISLFNKFQLIIEQPFSSQHYLLRYSYLKPTWIDYDRTLRGDYFKKPTMYFFINRHIKHNFVNEPLVYQTDSKRVVHTHGIERSLISKDYANRFIKEFIL